MKAIIMAGGEGTRLRPLTVHRPKPLVPVAGKPIMQHIIELLRKHGFKEAVATVHYLADEIEGYFGDGEEFGISLKYSVEDVPLGTAGSVKRAADTFNLNETLLILSGDALTDIDLSEAIAFHKDRGALVTIVLSRVSNPLEYGVVIVDEEGRIRRFLEKPSGDEAFSDTVNTGIYIIEPEVLSYIGDQQFVDFSQNLFPKLLYEGKPLYGFISKGYWCDVGNHTSYLEANFDVLYGKVKVQIDGEEIAPGIFVGEGADIGEAEIHPPVYIGSHSRIEGKARITGPAIIGAECVLQEGVKVERSVVWEKVFLGRGADLFGCIVGDRTICGERVKVGEGAIIGNHCTLEGDVIVQPFIKIWPNKIVERNSRVTMSLVWGGKWYGSLFRRYGIAGIGNLEITPEYATKLGAAFGSLFPKGSWVAVSRDSSQTARMIKRGFIAGLLSAGINVLNLQAMVLPITRFTIRSRSLVGGAHIRMVPYHSSLLTIELFDERGIELPPSSQRKLESYFFREDFRRVRDNEVGTIEYSTRVIENYREALLSQIDEKLISSRKFKLVIDYAFGRTSLVLPAILGILGLDVVALNPFVDPQRAPHSPQQRDEMLKELRNVVTALRADFGVFFEHSGGETLSIVAPNGEIVDGYKLLLLFALLLYKTGRKGDIVSYLHAPSALDELATRFGGKVIRTRPLPRFLLERSQNVLLGGNDSGGLVFPQFQPAFDSIFALAMLLQCLAQLEEDITDLLSELPSFHLRYAVVPCPWEEKARVMRILHRAEVVTHEYGAMEKMSPNQWVLVLPDISEPYLHIWAEGETPEEAEELLRKKEIEVRDLVKREAELI
ncbi:NTP transferase domain-containing protein [bacterium]|nr:NTP transferase domain-containing protein [bacterium]